MEKIPTPKRESGISRIIGVEESVEQEILEYFKRQFEKNERGPLGQEHTEELDALISQVNEKMKEFMARYGVQSLDISGRNIHIIDQSKLSPKQIENLEKRYETTNGIYIPETQQIGILERYKPNCKLFFLKVLAHEMIHMNAFTSAQKIKEGGLKLTKGEESLNLGLRRGGFEIHSDKARKAFFHYIDEAIIEELTIRFDHGYFPQFENLREEYKEREEEIKATAKRSGKSVKELKSVISSVEHKEGKNNQEIVLHGYSYYEQREKLNKLIDDLFKKNKSEFASREDVFTLFANAALSGRLMPIARLIEKTYGKGSFRILGEKTVKKETKDSDTSN